MHTMCKNNEKYNCKNARWMKKTIQCMWIQNTNDEKNLVKNQKNWEFSSFDRMSIDQTSIKIGKSQTSKTGKISIDWIRIKYESKILKLTSIDRKTSLIDRAFKNQNFWKTRKFSTKPFFKEIFHEWYACKWFQKFFKTH